MVNSLKIKRYIQMNLSKIKTDKSDAKMIQQYAEDCIFSAGLSYGQYGGTGSTIIFSGSFMSFVE